MVAMVKLQEGGIRTGNLKRRALIFAAKVVADVEAYPMTFLTARDVSLLKLDAKAEGEGDNCVARRLQLALPAVYGAACQVMYCGVLGCTTAWCHDRLLELDTLLALPLDGLWISTTAADSWSAVALLCGLRLLTGASQSLTTEARSQLRAAYVASITFFENAAGKSGSISCTLQKLQADLIQNEKKLLVRGALAPGEYRAFGCNSVAIARSLVALASFGGLYASAGSTLLAPIIWGSINELMQATWRRAILARTNGVWYASCGITRKEKFEISEYKRPIEATIHDPQFTPEAVCIQEAYITGTKSLIPLQTGGYSKAGRTFLSMTVAPHAEVVSAEELDLQVGDKYQVRYSFESAVRVSQRVTSGRWVRETQRDFESSVTTKYCGEAASGDQLIAKGRLTRSNFDGSWSCAYDGGVIENMILNSLKGQFKMHAPTGYGTMDYCCGDIIEATFIGDLDTVRLLNGQGIVGTRTIYGIQESGIFVAPHDVYADFAEVYVNTVLLEDMEPGDRRGTCDILESLTGNEELLAAKAEARKVAEYSRQAAGAADAHIDRGRAKFRKVFGFRDNVLADHIYD
eukprot:gene12951-15309_t